MPNHLAQETSPYLLQHANNPVNWWPWGPEALAAAKEQDRPIFLSIGYSACHWCHVMEHESFENAGLARALNENFINIKVDREERPDLDQIYMTAVQMITGRGGWPMSMFLTPELQPFFGGTYWPPVARMGMPGFDQVLAAVADAWTNRREQVMDQAVQLTDHLRHAAHAANDLAPLSLETLTAAAAQLERVFDHQHGGFGGAPKFPHSMDLRVMLRVWSRHPREELLRMVTFTLDKMAAGGIYDQLGGGFHRYSVDDHWLVPHFEKMLYDNALLCSCYVEAFQATKNPDYARVARETLDYVLREMTGPEGGYYSTQDADSEGEEGKFYVWSRAEVESLLGESAARTFCYVYDISPEGNFEGHNILNLPKTLPQCAQILNRDLNELREELAASRALLLAARGKRIWPGLDDKVLVNWNGLMIDTMAQAAVALNEPRYLDAAARAADFILREMRQPNGHLLHTWRGGRAHLNAYLDDYAALAGGLVSLFEAAANARWIEAAVELCDLILSEFADQGAPGFFYTARQHETLLVRQKDAQDSAVPSGNALAATVLLRLGKICGRGDYLEAAERTIGSFVPLMQQSPTVAGQMLIALDLQQGPTPELVLVGPAVVTQEILTALGQRYLPRSLLVRHDPAAAAHSGAQSAALAGILAGKSMDPPEPVLYVCENFSCQSPIVGSSEIRAAIARL